MALQERCFHDCEVKCTETEVAAKGRELARLLEQRDDVDEDKRETVKAFKVQLDGLDEEIRDTAKVVTSGVEMRPIECAERFVKDRALVETYRLDTGDVISERPMTVEEARQARQVNLELVPEKTAPAPESDA